MFLISKLHLNHLITMMWLEHSKLPGGILITVYPDIPIKSHGFVPSHGSLRGTCQSRFVSRRSGD